MDKKKSTDRYIAVDCGKFGTKVAIYNSETNHISKFQFRTMMDNGNFLDDALERNTFIAEYDGKTYKVGNGATKEATLETTKTSEIHKVATLCAIALLVNDGDNVHVAIGCPVKVFEVVEKRIEYKDFILPQGEVTIKLKIKSDAEPITKTFNIIPTSRFVYPETAGVLYLDMKKYADNTCGIIDIGGLNSNGCQYEDFEILHKYSFTNEFGGNNLVSGLSQDLTSAFGARCSEDYIRKLIRLPLDQRKLVPNNGNAEIQEKSKNIITEYMIDYVKDIKRSCDAKNWPLEYMDLTFVGGTTKILENEIKKVFGENIYIPQNPEYANVLGFLRRLCAKELGITIEINKEEKLVLNA